MYVKSGTNLNLPIDFIVDGDFVVPDSTSVTVTVSDLSGDTITGFDALAITGLDENSTHFTLTIPDTANTKTDSYEIRFVHCDFTVDSKVYQVRTTYQIVDRVDLPIAPQEIRNLLGLSSSELPDENIDLMKAYLDAEEDAGESLNTLITTGDTAQYIFEAVKLKAALNVLPVLELVAVQSEQADNVVYKRFQSIDFDAIRDAYSKRYNSLLQKAIPDLAGSESFSPVFSVLSFGDDSITGA